ncbi:NAD(P)-dependent dehydrogenase (short-subunit alcohol dehydrogenase family) [Novosphingobium chloroacetimidivorans]|uniref:NAD(P)-dependent dehydrogenase (Short-subunit alcohol dehydrogenase family) n=1 Tax=Novosphingobium chloroacetimidivorans TaxID=1428314 RepID=A0A7W7KDF1_9SPHN|nr:SDR family NAD(P)-dependent oxidoreductase [Novosphingobium chloroacetimidivorans]MBB4860771.1 NAD(P)-dependent dehydrogenase (short-subunit alcohol dehydrogenase family) [Novosphingobium chloroacetimidivorans]
MSGSAVERDLFGFAGRRILIVGGGQGMGEATARLLASLGAELALLDIEIARAERVRRDVEQLGVRAYAVQADVTDEASLTAAFAQVEREFGPVDGLVTIIGMAAWSSLAEMTTEIWDADHNRNLRYVFIAAREFARSLIARGAPGSLVTIASVDGLRSAQNHGSYGAAKAGLVNLVRTMAQEWAPHGIRANCVAPGGVVTPRIPLGDPEREAQGMANVPMKRRGTTDEIANAVGFLLSDMATYVTGQTLAVDGGYIAAGGFSTKLPAPQGQTIGVGT